MLYTSGNPNSLAPRLPTSNLASRPLLGAHLDDGAFEPEAAQLDGSFAHASERVSALCVRDQGLRIETAAVGCGEPDRPTPGHYPYAKRG